MSYPKPRLCRVSLHTEASPKAVQVDLGLPAGVPIAELMPSVVDILATRGGWQRSARAAAPYRLSRLGAAALDSSKTLAQHGIRDGTVLLLTRATTELPAPRFDDPAEHVAATIRARARPWTPRAARFTEILAAGWLASLGVLLLIRSSLAAAAAAAATAAGCALLAAVLAHRVHRDPNAAVALGMFAVGLAALAGFAAVPDGPGAPNALLAATAAAAVAALTMHLAGCGGPAMTAVCCLAVLAAAAALAVVLTQISPQVVGALAAAASIGLLQAGTRVSVALTGLSRPPGPPSAGPDSRAIRAHDLLTGLVAACSVAAALGVVGPVVGEHTSGGCRFGGVGLAAVTGATLLLRARSHSDRSQITTLVAGGIAALSVSLAAAAVSMPQHLLWPCATAGALAGAGLYLAFAAPAPSPVARRGIELLEYLVLAAVVPLACWICGCYGTARGLSLT